MAFDGSILTPVFLEAIVRIPQIIAAIDQLMRQRKLTKESRPKLVELRKALANLASVDQWLIEVKDVHARLHYLLNGTERFASLRSDAVNADGEFDPDLYDAQSGRKQWATTKTAFLEPLLTRLESAKHIEPTPLKRDVNGYPIEGVEWTKELCMRSITIQSRFDDLDKGMQKNRKSHVIGTVARDLDELHVYVNYHLHKADERFKEEALKMVAELQKLSK